MSINETNNYVGAYAPAASDNVSKAVEKIGQFNKFGSVLGLERITELLRRLGNPEKDLKIIHIAGTNGKGSVSRFVYSTLREAGYKVGIYSSPYLEVFNERIEADGQYIKDDELEKYADLASKIAKEMCDEGLLSPTEFDVVTAIAFMFFKDKNVDYVVLEVGLGGRQDSTNAIENPLVTAITSISLDHTDRLGSTICEIASEKAGIIKSCPVVTGKVPLEAMEVIAGEAALKGATIYKAEDKEYNITEESLLGSTFDFCFLGKTWEKIKIQMIGEHQVQNATVALKIIELLDLDISEESLRNGMFKAANPGRFEVVRKNPYVILDGAHNEAGILGLVKTLKTNFKDEKLLVITGMLLDKEVDKMCKIYKDLNADFIATEPNNPRKMLKDDLAKVLKENGLNVLDSVMPEEAIKLSCKLTACQENKYSGIIFSGSLYLIGEIRRLLHE